MCPQSARDVSAKPPKPHGAARTASGAVWLIASRVATRGLDFLTLVVLTHLLNPGDFGLVAIAMALLQTAMTLGKLAATAVLSAGVPVMIGLGVMRARA